MEVKLSPSRMNLFFECERCFWLRVNQGVKRPSGPFPSLPSGVDEVLKEHFDKFRERGEVPPELEGEGLELYPGKEFLEKARDWRTEPKWRDPETGALLRGGVDDLLVKDGSIVVMDYKTRGYPPKEESGVPEYYERQVNLYNLILRENGYGTRDFGLILYYYPDEVNPEGDFVFHSELRRVPVDVEEARRRVRESVETLKGEPPSHAEDCDYSDWKPRGY
ncbi:MAG: PD-(D/E)XK nuclease family protein [Candidatus Nanohaloarchaea archaeon]|nr:PD-(D/E)XK nuclease family protein [Candidatus Nanohaloarchaea archaeon]